MPYYTREFILDVNLNLLKFPGAHKGHVRKTSLSKGAISNQVGFRQTFLCVPLPGQNPRTSSRGDSIVLWW